MYFALSKVVFPKSLFSACARFFISSKGHTIQYANIAALPDAINCPILVFHMLVWLRNESRAQKKNETIAVDRGNITVNPLVR